MQFGFSRLNIDCPCYILKADGGTISFDGACEFPCQTIHSGPSASVMGALALIDGNPVRGLPCDSKNIVKGDAKSLSIAAASIIAKVTRDRLMLELDAKHPEYGFAAHKGYGTRAHLEAIRQHGPLDCHRKTFRPIAELNQGKLF